VLPGQHTWEGPPHASQREFPVLLMNWQDVFAAVHRLPVQHGCPRPPQLTQL